VLPFLFPPVGEREFAEARSRYQLRISSASLSARLLSFPSPPLFSPFFLEREGKKEIRMAEGGQDRKSEIGS